MSGIPKRVGCCKWSVSASGFRFWSATQQWLVGTWTVRVLAIGGAAKLVGMLVMIPAGYHFFGFSGALGGYSASDVLRYLLTGMVGARSGLSTWGEDAKLSLVGIASILAGVLMQNLVESANAMAMVEFAFIATTVFLVWVSIYFRTLLMLVAKFKGRAT